MKKQPDEKMFNVKNIKKGLQIGVLGTALAANTMMFTNCAQSDGGCSNGHYEGCPHWEEKNVQTTPLGNGNYTMTCFMIYDDAKKPEEVETDVNNNLTIAESYIKGLVTGFSESLNDRPSAKAYFYNSINEVNNIIFNQDQDNGYGFDWTILRLRNACKPVINDIYNNIDDIVNKIQFKIYYKALANEVYRYGFGGEDKFQEASTNFNPKEDYKNNKQDIIDNWNSMCEYHSITQPFNFATDLVENDCQEITSYMDNLINQATNNMGNGITREDLRNVVNLSFNINSLDSMHDYYGDIYDKHQGCSPIENEPIL